MQTGHLLPPVFGKIIPVRVHGLDKLNLVCAPPRFYLRFAIDGVSYVGPLLKPYEAVAVVFCGKASAAVMFVLEDSPIDVVRQAHIELAALAGHDVNPEAGAHGRKESTEKN